MDLKAKINKITVIIAKKANELFGDNLEKVILFGSYARGDYKSGSDVDIMILVDLSQEKHKLYRSEINELSSQLSLENDITVSIKLKDSNIVYRYKNIVLFYANVLNEV